MNPNEISILSDDLRPRDTPNHTLFKDFILQPMVPDLSITEEPRSEESFFPDRCQQPVVVQENSHLAVSSRQKPLLEDCKTYSEWKKKSALIAKSQPATVNHNHENSYVRCASGMTSPTVLDNLNSQVSVQTHNGHSATSPSGRQGTMHNQAFPVNGTGLKVSQSTHHSVSQKGWEAVPVTVNPQMRRVSNKESSPRQYFNSRDASRKSCSGNSVDTNFGHGNKHFAGNPPETSNCMGCAHGPHQPMTAINYNGMPVFHSYPQMGLPPCNGMSVKANSGPPVPSPKSRSVSRHSGVISGHSFNDSVVYDNLYQIVLSQSEQLKTLQAQVERLLINQENHRCNRSTGSERGNGNRHSTTVMERGTQTSDGESNIVDGEKRAIGVMTSFIHTVAYTERVGLVDSRNKGLNRNVTTDARNKMHNGHCQSTSTSPPSQTHPTSSSSSRGDSSPQNQSCKCDECVDKAKKNQKKKQSRNPDKVSQLDRLEEAFGKKGPGVSAAIRTVRGCQAALENESFPNDDKGRSELATGIDESIALSGADLPTVVEPPISPPSSVHIDLQEYDRSSSEDGSSSDGDLSSMSESDVDDALQINSLQNRRNGWNTYNNVLGPVNYLRGKRDSGDDDYVDDYSGRKQRRKGRENRPPRSAVNGSQANSVLKRVAFQHEPKSREKESAENLKELALKYLRENYPEELNSTEGYLPSSKPTGSHGRVQDMGWYSMGNNMSIATYRYLERYNLLSKNQQKIRIEELPGYGELPAKVESRGALTSGSPSRGYRGRGLPAQFEQQVDIGMRIPKDMPNDRASRPYVPHRQENYNPAQFESPCKRKQSSKVRHKRHIRHTNPAPTLPNGQQISPTSRILDITALRQQPKLL